MINFLKKKIIPKIFNTELKNLGKYYQIHKGEECYLFGDGISIKYFDLNDFNDKLTIPGGYLPFHKDFNKLNINYSILIEPLWFYPYMKNPYPPGNLIKNYIQSEYKRIIQNRNITLFTNISNKYGLRDNQAVYTYKFWKDPLLDDSRLAQSFDCFSGTFRASIFLAIYMGFSKIYLVGFDYTHTPTRLLHWYEKGEGILKNVEGYQKDFIEMAKEYADLITVTIDGGSDLMESITYKNLFGKEPIFKENYEIIEESKLKIVATSPGRYVL